MRLDEDLLRKILFYLEANSRQIASEFSDGLYHAIRINGYDHSAVSYHLRLLIESPFLEREYDFTSSYVRLSFMGHEFVELIRDDARWESAKTKVFQATGGHNIELLTMTLKESA